ncbi:MAG: hypothetical protein R3B99_13440 [Polyangiales bacterium]
MVLTALEALGRQIAGAGTTAVEQDVRMHSVAREAAVREAVDREVEVDVGQTPRHRERTAQSVVATRDLVHLLFVATRHHRTEHRDDAALGEQLEQMLQTLAELARVAGLDVVATEERERIARVDGANFFEHPRGPSGEAVANGPADLGRQALATGGIPALGVAGAKCSRARFERRLRAEVDVVAAPEAVQERAALDAGAAHLREDVVTVLAARRDGFQGRELAGVMGK